MPPKVIKPSRKPKKTSRKPKKTSRKPKKTSRKPKKTSRKPKKKLKYKFSGYTKLKWVDGQWMLWKSDYHPLRPVSAYDSEHIIHTWIPVQIGEEGTLVYVDPQVLDVY